MTKQESGEKDSIWCKVNKTLDKLKIDFINYPREICLNVEYEVNPQVNMYGHYPISYSKVNPRISLLLDNKIILEDVPEHLIEPDGYSELYSYINFFIKER